MIFSFINSHILTAAILLPFLAAAVVLVLPKNRELLVRALSVLISLSIVAIAFSILKSGWGSGEFLLIDSCSWIPSLGISYHVGADGVSALMILVVSILTFVALLSGRMRGEARFKMMIAALFVIEGGAIGVLSSLDAFLFTTFWQIILIPIALLIGSGGENFRVGAAMKFIVFAVAASLLMSIAIIYCGIKVGSFDLMDWYATSFEFVEQLWIFGAFAIAFAIWVPLLGVHTWMTDVIVKAPISVGVILLGIMTGLGAYGFFRFTMPFFPQAASFFQMPLAIIAAVCVVSGALLSMVQNNLKKIIAYSTISQMGLIIFGFSVLSKSAAVGSLFFMAGRALSVALLLMLVGAIEERAGSDDLRKLGWLGGRAPILSTFFVIAVLASIGLPFLMNFAGTFAILLGAFQSETILTSIVLLGLAILSISFLRMLQRVLFGTPIPEESARIADARAHEYAVVIPMAIMILVFGMLPHILMDGVQSSANLFVRFSGRIVRGDK